jgi:hypothetical protein
LVLQCLGLVIAKNRFRTLIPVDNNSINCGDGDAVRHFIEDKLPDFLNHCPSRAKKFSVGLVMPSRSSAQGGAAVQEYLSRLLVVETSGCCEFEQSLCRVRSLH